MDEWIIQTVLVYTLSEHIVDHLGTKIAHRNLICFVGQS